MSSQIITRSGRLVDPFNLQPNDIDIRDIAHALSHICRWNGHLPMFYSVAQHSAIVAAHLYHDMHNAELALVGLLHDASEAYIADVSRPVKQRDEMQGYRDAEHRIQTAIYSKFNLLETADRFAEELKEADNNVLANEAVQLGDWDISKWNKVAVTEAFELHAYDSVNALRFFKTAFTMYTSLLILDTNGLR